MNNKITSLITGLTLMAGSSLLAQTQKLKSHAETDAMPSKRTCGTMENHEFLKQTRPGYAEESAAYEKMLDEYISANRNSFSTQAVITVPVVIHVVYKTAAQNISDAQATSQIAVLNKDFGRTNTDTAIGSSFYNVAGRLDVQFALAVRDPNGNPTTGIVHKATTVTSFATDNKVKYTAQGGDDAWDPTKYMNIWVCNLGGGILGYGEFASGTVSNTYGLVLGYTCTGTMGTATAPYNKGRTGTHEFGHCFRLSHIWGDEPNCTGTDNCADTPNQAGENYGCPTLPLTDACATTAPGVMCMNFMDYTDDACMVMFTKNQNTRQLAVLTTAPYNSLQTSDGLTPVILVANDAGIFNVTSPTGTLCAGPIQPVTTIKNMGNTTLNNCTINYQIDGGTVNTTPWSGTLASLATQSITLPAITVAAGTHTLTVYTSNPNGGTDGNSSNDQSSTTFTAIGAGAGSNLPFFEGFEGATFPTSQNITLNNPDADITWATTNTASFSGTKSAFMDNWNYTTGAGQRDEMILPSFDLSGAGSTSMTFQVAYTYWSATGYSDTLEILGSGDCGATWSSIYKKWRTDLQTAPLVSSNSIPFTPSGASQWRQETVNLSAFDGNNNIKIMFRSISDYEDNLYIDDINISKTVGLKETNKGVFVNVYPNPSSGNLTVEIANNVGGQACEISIYNVIGQKVLNAVSVKGLSSVQTIDMSSLANGVYQVEVKSNNKSTFKKVVLNK